jgi:hypothetical protein
MADVPYGQGIPGVQPSGTPPDSYQKIDSKDANAFGASLAEGAVTLGKGMLAASKFFGEVAADDAYNAFDRNRATSCTATRRRR